MMALKTLLLKCKVTIKIHRNAYWPIVLLETTQEINLLHQR